ncbi:Enzymatic polyprotein, partial [Globisporangium splendens]
MVPTWGNNTDESDVSLPSEVSGRANHFAENFPRYFKFKFLEDPVVANLPSSTHVVFSPSKSGDHFLVAQAALGWFMKNKDMSGRLHRWALVLQEYDFDIVYRPGRENHAADCLSRAPMEAYEEKDLKPVLSVAGTIIVTAKGSPPTNEAIYSASSAAVMRVYGAIQITDEKIAEEQSSSNMCSALQQASSYRGYLIGRVNGLLRIKTPEGVKIVSPTSLWPYAFKEAHNSVWAGHLKVPQTQARLRTSYWWPRMRKSVSAWVTGCQDCGSRKARPAQIIPPLRSIKVGGICDRWALDLASPLHRSQRGNSYVVACVEYVSKFVVAVAVPDRTGETVARVLMEEVVLRYGPFRELLTDNARELTDESGTISSKSNGLVERFNRTLKDMVSLYVNAEQDDWDLWIQAATYAYSSAIQTTTGFTPNQLMTGQQLRSPGDLLRPELVNEVGNLTQWHQSLMRSLHVAQAAAREAIAREQKRQAKFYNRRVRHQFNMRVGMLVWVFKIPRGNKITKFRHTWRGPAKVMQSAGYDNYRVRHLDNDEESIAHASMLLPYFYSDEILVQMVNDTRLQMVSEDAAAGPPLGTDGGRTAHVHMVQAAHGAEHLRPTLHIANGGTFFKEAAGQRIWIDMDDYEKLWRRGRIEGEFGNGEDE